jgi:putative ABC transport system substrate-binding protein
MIGRRAFITLLGGAAVAWPLAARAQQPAIPVIGLLAGAQLESDSVMAAFHQGLGQAGYVEGRNVAIDVHIAEGRYDRLPALAADLVRRQAAVIAAITPVAALAAKAATTTIPIVFLLGSDPVKDGLVASLNRPGGNVTGITFFTNLLSSKRLQLLRELVPNATRIALLLNPNNANADLELHEAQNAVQTIGVQLIVARAGTEREIDAAFASLAQQQAGAVFTAGDAYFYSRRDQIAALAERHRLPTTSSTRDYTQAGVLMSYGAAREDSGRQWGLYVGRVLKGEKASDLPVVQPTRFELAINLKTAKALGLDVPATLLARADEVIE